MSRDLAHGNVRRKRDIGGSSKESVFFKLSAFGQEYHLNVTLNDELFSPHFKTEVRGKGSSEFHYDIEHCHYLGQLLPKHANKSKVAVSNCDGLVSIKSKNIICFKAPPSVMHNTLKSPLLVKTFFEPPNFSLFPQPIINERYPCSYGKG